MSRTYVEAEEDRKAFAIREVGITDSDFKLAVQHLLCRCPSCLKFVSYCHVKSCLERYENFVEVMERNRDAVASQQAEMIRKSLKEQ